jgi:hypothetical protein
MFKIKFLVISIILFSFSILSLETADAARLKDTFNDSLNKTAQGTGHLDVAISTKSPFEVVSFIIKTVLAFLGIAFLILMIYGGFKWMLSAGNEQGIGEAKKIIKNGFIGLIIIVSAYGITAFVGSLFSNN